ncbi:MAG: hypothetical protein ACXQTG_02805 [Methanoculleaceae archaeon]
MKQPVTVEIVGSADGGCGPFPCDDTRTCGLDACFPTGQLSRAYQALEEALRKRYGEDVIVTLTLVENGLPERILKIIEERHPPLPIILVNGNPEPIGRISLPMICDAIDRARKDQQIFSS